MRERQQGASEQFWSQARAAHDLAQKQWAPVLQSLSAQGVAPPPPAHFTGTPAQQAQAIGQECTRLTGLAAQARPHSPAPALEHLDTVAAKCKEILGYQKAGGNPQQYMSLYTTDLAQAQTAWSYAVNAGAPADPSKPAAPKGTATKVVSPNSALVQALHDIVEWARYIEGK